MPEQKRWNILQVAEDEADALVYSLKIHPVLCRILAERA